METKFNVGQVVFYSRDLHPYRIDRIDITHNGIKYGLPFYGGTKWAEENEITEKVDEAVILLKGYYDKLKERIDRQLDDLNAAANTLARAYQMVKGKEGE